MSNWGAGWSWIEARVVGAIEETTGATGEEATGTGTEETTGAAEEVGAGAGTETTGVVATGAGTVGTADDVAGRTVVAAEVHPP